MDSYLNNISPVDGRYRKITEPLTEYFSEFALIKARVYVETEYFIALSAIGLPQFPDAGKNDLLKKIYIDFSPEDAQNIKNIEQRTNHDIKAVEYFVKSKIDGLGLSEYREFVHFGLTSQDINNTAYPVLLKKAVEKLIIPVYREIIEKLSELAIKWEKIPMLGRTHGQAASPTTAGKELYVFAYRLKEQLKSIENFEFTAKFGGATGNFNAHCLAYPQFDWISFADNFIKDAFGLRRSLFTTQIDNYDNFAVLFNNISVLNNILSDLVKDIWAYIMLGYFNQKVVEEETGSSAMPHKVNPIDFENAEGNLGIANSLLNFLAGKLPVSRLQRDLSDSTVLRNTGMPLAHLLIAGKSILKGLDKLIINEKMILSDLDKHWEVISEGLQTILRREKFEDPYEKLKELTRGNVSLNKETLISFIKNLNISDALKEELLNVTPYNYIGTAGKIQKII